MAYADAVQAVLRIEREPLRIIMDDLAPKTLPSRVNRVLRPHTQLQRADLEKRPLALPKNIEVANPEDGQTGVPGPQLASPPPQPLSSRSFCGLRQPLGPSQTSVAPDP